MSDCDCPEIKCDEGIPAWVMTFADLMSLLLAFFVLLFSFSEMDKNVYKELAGSLKDAFGVQREIKAKETQEASISSRVNLARVDRPRQHLTKLDK